jgi:hypothetical protein
VKLRILPITSSAFLISALLFTQVGVNFFHRNHDVHENKSITAPLKAGQAAVQKHDEHCRVCSIDFFNHAFVSTTVIFAEHLFSTEFKKQYCRSVQQIVVSYTQGRAPPALL